MFFFVIMFRIILILKCYSGYISLKFLNSKYIVIGIYFKWYNIFGKCNKNVVVS